MPNACPHHSMYVVDSIFILYTVNLRLFYYILKWWQSPLHLLYISSLLHMLCHIYYLDIITQSPKYSMQKYSTSHYNCITQLPVLCHNVPQAISQKPWPYAVTKNIIKHNVSSRYISLWYTKLASSISKENNFIAWNPNFPILLRLINMLNTILCV